MYSSTDFKKVWFQRGTVHFPGTAKYIKTGKSNFIVLLTELPVKLPENQQKEAVILSKWTLQIQEIRNKL